MDSREPDSQIAVNGFFARCPMGDMVKPGDEVVFTLASWWHLRCLHPH